MLQLHTTRSWDFMGLRLHTQMEESSQMHLKFGDDVIVGILDTGIPHLSTTYIPAKPCNSLELYVLERNEW